MQRAKTTTECLIHHHLIATVWVVGGLLTTLLIALARSV